MNAGLVVQALRRHRAALLGPVCTQVVAAAIIAAMVDLHRSITTTTLSPATRDRSPVTDVAEAGDIFLHDAVYLSVVIVGITMSLAIGRQLRDIALLQSVGASPAQIRHSVVGQAAATALPAAVLGALLAVPGCALWLRLLTSAGVLPDVSFAVDPVSFVAAAGVVFVTSMVGAYLAAVRASRRKPAAALVAAGSGASRGTPLRTVAGTLLVVVGVVLAVVLSMLVPDQMADAGVFVMLAECVGAGLLSPALLRTTTHLVQRLVRHDLAAVAAVDLRTQARALGGAVIPLVLSVAFTAVNVGLHATAADTGHADSAVSRWMDYSGTATFGAFAAVAALTCFGTVAVSRRRELAALQLAGAPRAVVLRLLGIEAAVVAATALVVAAFVAVVALVPVVHASYGVWVPRFPIVAVVLLVLLVGGVVAAGTLVPAVRLVRQPPVRVVAAAL